MTSPRNRIFLLPFVFELLLLQSLPAFSSGDGNGGIENFSKEKLMIEFTFFKGDSLAGYDFIKGYNKALEVEHIKMLNELRAFFYLDESAFVKKKYGIKEAHLTRKNIPAPRGIVSSACNNFDFENGDYTGWIGNVGYNQNSSVPFFIAGTATGPTMSPYTDGIDMGTSDCNYFSLMDAFCANDSFGNFPGLDLGGGNWALRIGDEMVNLYNGYCGLPTQSNLYSGSESVEQTFIVTPSNALVIYDYAVVLNDGGHASGGQPYFEVLVLDSLGNEFPPCFQFYQECTNGIPPFDYFTSAARGVDGASPVFYLPWSENILYLTPLIGLQVTIRFVASGCAFGGHFGYAYIDARCGSPSIAFAGNLNCQGSGIDTLSAPSISNATFLWTGPGIVGSNTTQTIIINAIGTYSVVISPSGGCGIDSLSINVTGSTMSTSGSSTPVLCSGDSTASASVAVSSGSPPYTFAWNTSPVQTSATATNLSAGNYTVQITDSIGCIATQLVTITEPSALSLSTSVTQPSCISCADGIIALTPGGGTTPYTYTLTPAVGNFTGTSFINLPSGHYYLCLVDSNNCQLCDSVIVPQNTTGISTIQNSAGILLFPNPVTEGTILKLNSIPPDNTVLLIYDAVGKMVTEIKINSMNTFIDKTTLPAKGIYFWHLEIAGKNLALGKLVVIE